MKLLSPTVNKDAQQIEIARKLLRSVEEMAAKANMNLAKAEADFADTMARNQAKWLVEEVEHNKMMIEREREVEALEKRKIEALIPIEIYKKEADTLMEKAQTIVKRAKQKESENEDLQELLYKKLTDVADREYMLVEGEKRIEIAKLGVIDQQQVTQQGVERLTIEMANFHVKQQEEEKNLEERKREVYLAELSFSAKTKKYTRDLHALQVFEIQLKDREATLDREIQRRK
jgi:hypothetical protein